MKILNSRNRYRAPNNLLRDTGLNAGATNNNVAPVFWSFNPPRSRDFFSNHQTTPTNLKGKRILLFFKINAKNNSIVLKDSVLNSDLHKNRTIGCFYAKMEGSYEQVFY